MESAQQRSSRQDLREDCTSALERQRLILQGALFILDGLTDATRTTPPTLAHVHIAGLMPLSGHTPCDEGYTQTEKLARDDHGDAWRKKRRDWCTKQAKVTDQRWKRKLQGTGDFRLWKYFPSALKERFAVKSAPRTIMSKGERRKAALQKPRKQIFKRKEYKKVRQVSDICSAIAL